MSKPYENYEGLPFDDEAMQLIAQARTEADRFNHNFIGTEHLLLAQAKLNEPFLSRVAENLGISTSDVAIEVERQIGTGPDQKMLGDIPMTPRTKKILQLANKEAAAMGSTAVNCVHILLGHMREAEGIAARVLKGLGADLEGMRELARKYFNFETPADKAAPSEAFLSPELEGLFLVVDRGSAPPEVIAEILCDLSLLYRKVGGSGITFSFDEAHVSDEEVV